VSDRWQNRGLGSELLRHLIAIAREEKLDRISGPILAENQGMQRVCREIGFHLEREQGEDYMAELVL
jgi:acetyltransferase